MSDLVPVHLTISGEVKDRERTGVMRQHARRTGSFRYRTSLPARVDPDRVEARLSNGILTIRVPRPDHTKPRCITIT
jgi:HSP20 family protein